MLDTVRKRYTTQEVDTHPHSWIIPEGSRKLRARSSDGLPLVPSPTIFRDVAIPYSLSRNSTAPPTFEQYPAPGHVASHLLLVECVQELRTNLSCDDSIRQSRWIAYLQVAITRFKLWITKIESVLRHSATFNPYGTGSHLHGAFTINYLPPLDVLFVWNCYLQNPAAYERLLASNDFRLLSQICFPWHTLTQAIDAVTLEYKTTSATRTLWKNLVNVPFDQESYFENGLETNALAFTSASVELLELVVQQSDLLEKICGYHWLRSPALRGTIERGISRYAEHIKSLQTDSFEVTQQIPVGELERNSMEELDLDIVCQLIRNTHRAFHSAWKCFTQRYNLEDEELAPPPSYHEIQPRSQLHELKANEETPIISVKDCYCWVCERVKDAQDEQNVTQVVPSLSSVSSPEEVDEKRFVRSNSSSSSGEVAGALELNKTGVKNVKKDVRVYRRIEALRRKQIRKNSG